MAGERNWSDLDGYTRTVQSQGVSINIAPLIRPFGIAQGAFGMSTGLTVPPSCYADTDEIVSLASVMSPYDHAFYATPARVWAGWHINAIEEAVEIG